MTGTTHPCLEQEYTIARSIMGEVEYSVDAVHTVTSFSAVFDSETTG